MKLCYKTSELSRYSVPAAYKGKTTSSRTNQFLKRSDRID
jgi:hypothetical protein